MQPDDDTSLRLLDDERRDVSGGEARVPIWRSHVATGVRQVELGRDRKHAVRRRRSAEHETDEAPGLGSLRGPHSLERARLVRGRRRSRAQGGDATTCGSRSHALRRRSGGSHRAAPRLALPITKNVARARCSAKISRIGSVHSPGPSSNVSAICWVLTLHARGARRAGRRASRRRRGHPGCVPDPSDPQRAWKGCDDSESRTVGCRREVLADERLQTGRNPRRTDGAPVREGAVAWTPGSQPVACRPPAGGFGREAGRGSRVRREAGA